MRGGHRGERVQLDAALVTEPRERREQIVPLDHDRRLVTRDDDIGIARRHRRRELGDGHLKGSSVRTFFWSVRIPYISISGFGGHPGTYTSTGTIVSTPWTTA